MTKPIDRLRAFGMSPHCTIEDNDNIQAVIRDLLLTRKALSLALKWLEPNEPGDSRAVSDEFVAMAAVLCECPNDDCEKIIDKALG